MKVQSLKRGIFAFAIYAMVFLNQPSLADGQEIPVGGGGGFGGGDNAAGDGGGFGSFAAAGGDGGYGAGMAAVDFERYRFDGIVRVTYEEKVAGVVLQSKSMAGMIISLEPLTIATCASILKQDESRKNLELSEEAMRTLRIETLSIPNISGGYGYGSMGSGYGAGAGMPSVSGMGESSIQLDSIDLSASPTAIARGLLFVTDTRPNISPVGRFRPLNLASTAPVKSLPDESGSIFELSSSTTPVFPNIPKVGNSDGQVCLISQGFESYFCDGGWMHPNAILSAFLESRKSLQPQAPSNQEQTEESNVASMFDIAATIERLRENSRQGPGRNRVPQPHFDALVPIIVQYKQANNEEEKKSALAELTNTVALDFDAQRRVKAMELNSLRERLARLEKEEQTLSEQKSKIISDRVKELTE